MMFRELLDRVRRRPGMYGLDDRYKTVTAFVNGCDAGSQGVLLEGFHEWLQVRDGRHTNLAWTAQVANLADEDTDAARIEAMYTLLDEFLADRDRGAGLTNIYFRYFELLRREGLEDLVTGPRSSPPAQ